MVSFKLVVAFVLVTCADFGFGFQEKHNAIHYHLSLDDSAMQILGHVHPLASSFASLSALLLAVSPSTQQRFIARLPPQLAPEVMSRKHRMKSATLKAGGWSFDDLVAILRGRRGSDNSDMGGALLSSFEQAVHDKGKSDIEMLRMFASLVGLDTNSTIAFGASLNSRLNDLLESPRERRLKSVFAASFSILTCEAVQLAVVSFLAWLLGVGNIRRIAGGLPRSTAALMVALGSRGPTRVLRLVFEIYYFNKMRVTLATVPPRRRLAFVARQYAKIILPSVILLMMAASLETLMVNTRLPPAAWIYQSLLRIVGFSKSNSARKSVAAMVTACGRASSCVQDLAGASASLASLARSVKPLRALLDLCETDAWLGDISLPFIRMFRRSVLALSK